jgi:dihydrofolate synthase / folylpolyglutamate synthase
LIIADSAHNESGLKSTFEAIAKMEKSKLHIITGFVNDKDVDSIIPYFPVDAIYYFAKANIPRGLDALELQKMFKSHERIGKKYKKVRNALQAAKKNAAQNDLILIVGSIFVVAEVI